MPFPGASFAICELGSSRMVTTYHPRHVHSDSGGTFFAQWNTASLGVQVWPLQGQHPSSAIIFNCVTLIKLLNLDVPQCPHL